MEGTAVPGSIALGKGSVPAQLAIERLRDRGEGPKALMAAVLKDAIVAARYNSRQAERWIRAEDWDWPFSFNNICLALNLDAARLRDAIFRPMRL
jgi:hypothetical protein